MKRPKQVTLPFERLPDVVELVGGTSCCHLRAVGATQTFCGLPVPNPTSEKPRRSGWGRTPEPLRCARCDRQLRKFRDRRR